MLDTLRQKFNQQKLDSVGELLLYRCLESPDDNALSYPDAQENWQTLKWSQVLARVRAIAAALRDDGLALEERASILSLTRVEWILADLAVLTAGGATTTIYPSNTAAECEFILKDSSSSFVFAEDDSQVAKLLEIRENIPGVRRVIVFNGTGSADGWVTTLADYEAKGKTLDAAAPDAFVERLSQVKRSHIATLIYTSGTTGTPKGVELLHDSWIYIGEALNEVDLFKPDDKQFLWLPLAHSFGKVLEVAFIAANLHTAVDGRIPRIVENLAVVQPTFMAAAPRIFEKVYNKIVTGIESKGGISEKIFKWALSVGKRVSKERQEGREPTGFLALQAKLADKLVFGKIKTTFGGRVRFFISGSAPLSRDMAEFFHACGILILEGYGLTESSAASFVNRPDNFKFGTVGPPIPNTMVKIDPADGEILIKSRGIMQGYHGLAEKTAETLEDGWLRTGDIGELDEGGRLRITDRKKDLIKTSGGKYVAPQALESRLKALCPYLGNVLVHGNNRNYCVALVTLDEEAIVGWAKDRNLPETDIASLSKSAPVNELVQSAVHKLNAELPSYSTLKYFAILPADFTVETGELTASLKMKRKVIEQANKEILDGFYKDALRSI